jgi:hypothetical protein
MVGAVVATAFVVVGSARPAYACDPVTDPYCEGVEIVQPGHPGGRDEGGCTSSGPYGSVSVPCQDPDRGSHDGGNCYVRRIDTDRPPPPGAQTPGGWYVRSCYNPENGVGVEYMPEWIPDAQAPTMTPEQLARRALAALRLLPPDIQLAPDPSGSGLVGLPVWMWTTVTPNTWGPLTTSDSDGPLVVTLTVQAVSITWDMGDGTVLTCRNPGTPYEPRYGHQPSPTCGHTYTAPSLSRPGGVYPVTATTTWRASWSGGGQSGAFTVLRQASTSVRIGELQVVTE